MPAKVSSAAEQDAIEDLPRCFSMLSPANPTSYDEAVRMLATTARTIRQTIAGVNENQARASLRAVRAAFGELRCPKPTEANGLAWGDIADDLAQMTVFGTLLARIEVGADINPVALCEALNAGRLSFLNRSLLGLDAAEPAMVSLLQGILRDACDMINRVAPRLARPNGDWTRVTYLYEDFFAAYRPEDRFKFGVFYTAMEVARYQVREVSRVLSEHFGLQGILDPAVRVLDPACGTGAYLLALAEVAVQEALSRQLPISATLQELFAHRVVGLELSPGPACVAQARLAAWLRSPPHHVLMDKRLAIHTVNTLALPVMDSAQLQGYLWSNNAQVQQPAGDATNAAAEVLVVIGNPPWGRRSREYFRAGIIDKLGDKQNLLAEWASGADGAAQSVYDLYIAFWRFACQLILERTQTQPARGIVSFMTNRTWIRGAPFTAMRGYLRDRGAIAYVTDLGGDVRAGDSDDDQGVFAIKAGSAITTLVFGGSGGAAQTHFRRLRGQREDKLRQLDEPPSWRDVPGRRTDPFIPANWGALEYARSVRDFFAASMPGVKTHRDDLVVGINDTELLATLTAWNDLSAIERAERFHASRGRTAPAHHAISKAHIRSYRYRPLDSRMLYAPAEFIQEPGRISKVYASHPSARCLQFLESCTVSGPVIIGASALPDYHSVRGSYGSHAVMIDGATSNSPGQLESHGTSDDLQLLSEWARTWARSMRMTTQQVGCYLLALGNAPLYIERFGDVVKSEPPRMPATIDSELIADAIAVGGRLLQAWSLSAELAGTWCHHSLSGAPLGHASIEASMVSFDNGAQLVGLHEDIDLFEVSGYPVFRRYLSARSHCALSPSLATDIRRVAGSLGVILNHRTAADELLARALQSRTFSCE